MTLKQQIAQINRQTAALHAVRMTIAELDTAELHKCEDCDGSGNDIGSLNPYYPEVCPTCHGSGLEPEPEITDSENEAA
jgi:DnaJ-class molecular chaperone